MLFVLKYLVLKNGVLFFLFNFEFITFILFYRNYQNYNQILNMYGEIVRLIKLIFGAVYWKPAKPESTSRSMWVQWQEDRQLGRLLALTCRNFYWIQITGDHKESTEIDDEIMRTVSCLPQSEFVRSPTYHSGLQSLFSLKFPRKTDNLSTKWKAPYGTSLKDTGWVVFFLEVDGHGIAFIQRCRLVGYAPVHFSREYRLGQFTPWLILVCKW